MARALSGAATAPSLRRLLARHELALLALVMVTAGFGALALYFAGVHAEQAQRSAALRAGVQAVEVRVEEGLRDAAHATAMLDAEGAQRWQARAAEIEARLRHLRELADDDPSRISIEQLDQASAPVRADIEALFRGAPMERESRRLRMLGPVYSETVLARYEIAVRQALQTLDQRQSEDSDRLARRLRWLLLLMPLPLLLAVLLVLGSRKALERQVLAPVRGLGAAAARLPEAEAGPPLAEAGAAEIAELARAFNQMRQSLEESRQAMLQHERQAALGALVPVVAHNIRNPLASIRANAQLLDDTADRAEVAESRQTIMETVDRLEAWVSSLLAYLGPLRPRLQTLDLADLLASVTPMLTHLLQAKQVALRAELPPAGVEWIEADAALCEQLIHGLLLNAVEAAPSGGEVQLYWSGEARRLMIDNPGSDAGFHPRPPAAMVPGPTTKARGTGLGIPFAYKVCEAHGWTLAYESPRPGWTRVHITFRETQSGQDR